MPAKKHVCSRHRLVAFLLSGALVAQAACTQEEVTLQSSAQEVTAPDGGPDPCVPLDLTQLYYGDEDIDAAWSHFLVGTPTEEDRNLAADIQSIWSEAADATDFALLQQVEGELGTVEFTGPADFDGAIEPLFSRAEFAALEAEISQAFARRFASTPAASLCTSVLTAVQTGPRGRRQFNPNRPVSRWRVAGKFLLFLGMIQCMDSSVTAAQQAERDCNAEMNEWRGAFCVHGLRTVVAMACAGTNGFLDLVGNFEQFYYDSCCRQVPLPDPDDSAALGNNNDALAIAIPAIPAIPIAPIIPALPIPPITPASAGCPDMMASNYDPGATLFGDWASCIYPSGCTVWGAVNYDPTARTDDGSCVYNRGCPDMMASNYDPGATLFGDWASCTYVTGCTMPGAVNYNPDARRDDGSCEMRLSCYDALLEVCAVDWDGCMDLSMICTADEEWYIEHNFVEPDTYADADPMLSPPPIDGPGGSAPPPEESLATAAGFGGGVNPNVFMAAAGGAGRRRIAMWIIDTVGELAGLTTQVGRTAARLAITTFRSATASAEGHRRAAIAARAAGNLATEATELASESAQLVAARGALTRLPSSVRALLADKQRNLNLLADVAADLKDATNTSQNGTIRDLARRAKQLRVEVSRIEREINRIIRQLPNY